MRSDDALLEAQRASVAFHIALTQIGAETVLEALALWRRVNPADVSGTANAWLEDAITMILSRRRSSQDLALAYYRLVRALRTGTTIPSPRVREPRYVTLDMLRDEFNALAYPDGEIPDEVAEQELHEPADDNPLADLIDLEGNVAPSDARPEQERLDAEPPAEIDEGRIVIEFDWTDLDNEDDLADLTEELDGQDEWAEQLARELLEAQAANLVEIERRSAAYAKRRDEAKAEAQRSKGRANAATTVAGISQMVVANGGRGAQEYLERHDTKVLAYARVSKTGTPCYFCAMLIGRGAVYTSAQAAGGAFWDDGHKYHPHCNCFAVPIFWWSDYRKSSMFDLNRTLDREYNEWKNDPQYGDDFTGRAKNDILNAWRHYWSRRQ